MASIACTGSIALDTTRTPFKTAEMVLGGAASYFSLAAGFFATTYISSVVGDDFPTAYRSLLARRADLTDLQQGNGRTFHFDSTFSYDLYHRHANKTELNVLADFVPRFSGPAQESEILYLATMPPGKQMAALGQVPLRQLVFMDTIELYVKTERADLESLLKQVDGVVLNDAEARMLTEESNLVKAGRKIHAFGPRIVVLKKGEHGSLLFYEERVIPFPAFPLENVVDPTGAGDAFAGGLLGALARQNALRPTLQQLKTAMAYANVMGSLAVEDFSVTRLADATSRDVESRFREYCELLRV